MALTFEQWRTHIDYVVTTQGQWCGVLDDEGKPLIELPAPISVQAPEQRLAASSVESTFAIDATSEVVRELAADFGTQDDEGRLIPADGPVRLLCFIRKGERRAYFITHVVLEGALTPSTMKINGTDLVEMLSYWPCPSTPIKWTQTRFENWTTDASGVIYKQTRQLAQVPFATALYGHSLEGPAVSVIRKIIQDSIDAVNELFGWNTPHAVVDYSATNLGPEVLVKTADDFIWDTIAEPARTAGISIEVNLWWPGDPPVKVRTSRDTETTTTTTWDVPMQIVRVNVMEEKQ